MAESGSVAGDGLGEHDPTSGNSGSPRNPLTCDVCHDYYSDPCLLSCFHTFCARCIRGFHIDNKISCPTCGQMTQLKDGAALPPADQLMRQLVELANSENPPCANCDKRDKSAMFFCTTCCQALCTQCREPTHQAKMFSSHEVVHMSKCAKDTHRRCPTHGEQYIMYSQSAKCMLCATCFRETPADARVHCVDIDSAWQQTSKKMERTANHICELQAGVHNSLLALKSQLDDLRRSLDTEKKSLNASCHGMQEVVKNTHSSVLSELQRQFETKERMSTKPPQRGPAKSGGQQQDTSGPFSNHCRTFDSQLKELSQQLTAVKERLGELHRDVAVLRRANTPPLGSRYEHVARDCRLLEQQLEHHQNELEKLGNIFDALWKEQLCKIYVEKEIFNAQMNDIVTLRDEVKHLQNLAHQLEPFVKSFSAGVNAGEMRAAAMDSSEQQHLELLLGHLARLQMQEPQQPQTTAPTKEYRHPRNPATSADNALYMKEQKEVPTRCRTPSGGVAALLDSGRNIFIYGTTKPSEAKRAAAGQPAEKGRQREDRKKSPGREDGSRDRSQGRRSRKSPDNAKPKTPPGHGGSSSSSKVRSLYRSLKGERSSGSTGADGAGSGGQDVIEQHERCSEMQQRQNQSAGAEESEYQRISEASTMGEAKKRVQAQVHAAPTDDQQPTTPKSIKLYPMSDPEDVFYPSEKSVGSRSSSGRRRRRASCDSLSTTGSANSPSSSIIDATLGQTGMSHQGTMKSLFFGTPLPEDGSSGKTSLAQSQRSWGTFPRPKAKRAVSLAGTPGAEVNATGLGPLKKADSFEGHEETVRTLVAAVQETRSLYRNDHAHRHRYRRKSKTN